MKAASLRGHLVLTIENEGPMITSTNYWSTELATRGYLYVNAGAMRVLVPAPLMPYLAKMKAAKEVLVSRGPWPGGDLADAVELLFDDGTPTPYHLQIDIQQLDRVPLDRDSGSTTVCTAWTEGPTLEFARPAYYRRVPKLPWLKVR